MSDVRQEDEDNAIKLPEEAIMNIFNTLQKESDRKNFKLVCRTFNDAVSKNAKCSVVFSEVRREEK